MVLYQASSKESVNTQPVMIAAVGNVCQLDIILPTFMDPHDISTEVTWNGTEVEKLSADSAEHAAVEMDLLRSPDLLCDLDIDYCDLDTCCDLHCDLMTLTRS